MSIDFGATKEGSVATPRMPRLKRPYCGPMYLRDVDKGEYQQQPLLQFNFVCLDSEQFADPSLEKVLYTKTEWPITSEDLTSNKAQNELDRIAYILRYFIGEEDALKLVRLQGDTIEEAWENLVENVVEHMQTINTQDKIIRGKVLGSVWKGKERLDMPNYVGFLSDDSSEYPVTFGNKEEKNNKEYMAVVNETPDDNSSVTSDATPKFDF